MQKSCLLYAPNWGPGSQPRHCALTRNQTGSLSVLGLALNPLSHTSQSSLSFFKKREDEPIPVLGINHNPPPTVITVHVDSVASPQSSFRCNLKCSKRSRSGQAWLTDGGVCCLGTSA